MTDDDYIKGMRCPFCGYEMLLEMKSAVPQKYLYCSKCGEYPTRARIFRLAEIEDERDRLDPIRGLERKHE